MFDDLNTRLEDAKRQVDQQQRLKQKLPLARENLTKEAHRLRMLEYQLQQVTDDLTALESVTLSSFVEWLLGRKERKLTEGREEVAELQKNYDECVDTIATLDKELHELEQQLEQLGNVDETYQTLCDDIRRLIIEEGTDASGRLGSLTEGLGRAKTEIRKVKTAIQTGEHLLERLCSMTRTAGRARNNTVRSTGVGAIAAVATNAINRRGVRGSVNRAEEGLARFGQILGELDLSSDTPTDLALAGLGPVICASCAELSVGGAIRDRGAAGPFLDTVQEAIGHLREKSKEMEQHIRDIEQEQRTLIENA